MLMKLDTHRVTRCLFSFASKEFTGRKSSSENKPENIPVNECIWNTLKIWRNSQAVCETGSRSLEGCIETTTGIHHDSHAALSLGPEPTARCLNVIFKRLEGHFWRNRGYKKVTLLVLGWLFLPLGLGKPHKILLRCCTSNLECVELTLI